MKNFFEKVYRRGTKKISDKYRRISYRIWFELKRISFKSREEKIRGFDEILRKNRRIYFTTDLVKTGFTDQLIGFTFLYKTGKELGMEYRHTPLVSLRSSDPFFLDPLSGKNRPEENERDDVFDFLGVNDCLEEISCDIPASSQRHLINLDLLLFRNDDVDDYKSLIEELKAVLYPFLHRKKPLFLTFKAEPRTYFGYYKYTTSDSTHNIDFRNCFEKKRRALERESIFSSNSINVMVHIRQGDTATIQTPWNTYIPVWHEIEGKFTQFKYREDIQHQRSMEVDEFRRFLENLLNHVDPDRLSTAVFSDGFKKAFRWIYLHSKRRHVSAEEIDQLKRIEQDYERKQFRGFEELPGVKTVIGEEVQKLYQLIDSFMDADIIIIGTHQIMLPKLLAVYGDRENMPLLITLYHGEKPNLGYIGFPDAADFLMWVDLDDYSIADVAKKIDTYAEEKKRPG